jgi:hypothetical protein
MDKDEGRTDFHPIGQVRQGRQTSLRQVWPEGDHGVIYTSNADSTPLAFLK